MNCTSQSWERDNHLDNRYIHVELCMSFHVTPYNTILLYCMGDYISILSGSKIDILQMTMDDQWTPDGFVITDTVHSRNHKSISRSPCQVAVYELGRLLVKCYHSNSFSREGRAMP